MAGHWLNRAVCFLAGHGQRTWTFGRHGVIWRCERCGHEERSRVLTRGGVR